MNNILRIAIRVAAVIGIAIFCGASGCTKPVGDIMYAPGYGYVVKVEQFSGILGGGPKDNSYYYIFPTKERAEEFYHQYNLDPVGFRKTLRPGELEVFEGDHKYDEISKLLRPLPPPPALNEMEIPLAVPELPQPIPQTPQ